MGTLVSHFSDEMLVKNKVSGYIKPKHYGNMEGPMYTTLDYNEQYATRHYQASLWVSTVVVGDFEDAWKEGVPRLQKYFKGNNLKKWQLSATCPVVMRKTAHASHRNEQVSLLSALTERHKITVSMFVPRNHTQHALGPTDPHVFLQEEHKRIFYCGYYRRCFTESTLEENLDAFRAQLTHNNAKFDDSSIFVALYQLGSKMRAQKYFECWVYGEKMERDFVCVKSYENDDDGE